MSKKVDFSQIQLTQTHQNYAKASSLLILDVAKKKEMIFPKFQLTLTYQNYEKANLLPVMDVA
jgi:Leucine-rich repeat (LRR) protein